MSAVPAERPAYREVMEAWLDANDRRRAEGRPKLTTREAARLLGVQENYLSQIRNGSKSCSAALLARIFAVLKS